MYVRMQVSPELSGVVSHICFSDTHVSGGGTSPAVFAATMSSSVIRYHITLPDPRERLSKINKAFVAGKLSVFVAINEVLVCSKVDAYVYNLSQEKITLSFMLLLLCRCLFWIMMEYRYLDHMRLMHALFLHLISGTLIIW